MFIRQADERQQFAHTGLAVATRQPGQPHRVTSTEYRIPVENVPAFLIASRRLRRMRGRNGARRFALLQDVTDTDLWSERFELPTWLDYLRLRARMTVTDRAIEAEIVTFTRARCLL